MRTKKMMKSMRKTRTSGRTDEDLLDEMDGCQTKREVEEVLKKNTIRQLNTDMESLVQPAIKTFVRKLQKKSHDDVMNFVNAVVDRDEETGCVRIPRSLDGRTQVHSKKVVPHVLTFQIFRNPHIRSYHDLVSIPSCRFNYQDSQRTLEVCINPYHYESNKELSDDDRRVRFERTGQKRARRESQDSGGDNGYLSSDVLMIEHTRDRSQSPSQGYELTAVHTSPDSFFATLTGQNETNQYFQRQYDNGNQQPVNEKPQFTTLNSPDSTSQYIDGFGDGFGRHPWISIIYYEFNKDHGEKYTGPRDEMKITVDGGYDPHNSRRMCIGRFNNIDRDKKTEQLRCHIQHGIELRLVEKEGRKEVRIVNKMRGQSVFVQSPNWNARAGVADDTVRKIQAGEEGTIFCHADFAIRLQNSVPKGREAVQRMALQLQTRISFIKGWGKRYPARSRITQCPIWIEINWSIGLNWLDHVISQMPHPEGVAPTSNS